MANLASDFKEALKTIEQEKTPDAVLAFFGEDAKLTRLNGESYEGEDGAKQFWNEYLETFKSQETTFNHTTEGDGTVVLEWTSKGKLPNDKDFEYRGVSVLEGEGEKVSAFRTYYDSAVFVSEGGL